MTKATQRSRTRATQIRAWSLVGASLASAARVRRGRPPTVPDRSPAVSEPSPRISPDPTAG